MCTRKILDVHTQCQEAFQLLFILFVMTTTTKQMRPNRVQMAKEELGNMLKPLYEH